MSPAIGVVGLGVLGANLARNIENRGVPWCRFGDYRDGTGTSRPGFNHQ
jgi:6-phosphogluconate dehydrogenase